MADVERGLFLIEEAVKQRRMIDAEVASEVEAVQMIPDLRAKLAELICDKIPAPEVIVRSIDNDDSPLGDNDDRLTRLTALVPVRGEKSIPVTIEASTYPQPVNPKIKPRYLVDIEPLDGILIVDSEQAMVQSREWESEPFTQFSLIGGSARSWPKWKRKATRKDIERYEGLLQLLNRDDVAFEGSAPPIIRLDFSRR